MAASDHALNRSDVSPCLKGGVHRWKADFGVRARTDAVAPITIILVD
jgi:hypothetical protein